MNARRADVKQPGRLPRDLLLRKVFSIYVYSRVLGKFVPVFCCLRSETVCASQSEPNVYRMCHLCGQTIYAVISEPQSIVHGSEMFRVF